MDIRRAGPQTVPSPLVRSSSDRAASAKRLGIHPTTASNRARACEMLIGRPLTEHPVELQVALALVQTLGVERS